MSAVIIASSVAASTAAISASTSARMEREKTEQCVLFVEGFDSRKSTVVEQKQYASCVQRLNPDPKTESETAVGKVCVVALLIALVVGMIYGWKEDGWYGSAMFGMCFPLFLAFGVAMLLMVATGIGFVFS